VGQVAVVGDRDAAIATADELASDLVAAAAAGRRARRAVDDHHDLRTAARTLLTRLGLVDHERADLVTDRLAELHAPASARITHRAHAAVATLTPRGH
jgi:hypothetical protein